MQIFKLLRGDLYEKVIIWVKLLILSGTDWQSCYFQNAFFPSMISSGPSRPRQEGRKEGLVSSDEEAEAQLCLLLGRTTAFSFGSEQIVQVALLTGNPGFSDQR